MKNLTPHPVILLREDADGPVEGLVGVGPRARRARFREVARFPGGPRDRVPRVALREELVGELRLPDGSAAIVRRTQGDPEGVPEEKGTYIVPLILATRIEAIRAEARAAGRGDPWEGYIFLVPDDAVRDESGRIIGCTRFAVC